MLRTPTLIDYTQEDFATNGQTCDVIFDAVGMHSFRRSKTSLNPGGMYLATDHLRSLALALWTSRIGSKKVVFPIPPRYTKKDVLFLSVETEQKTGNVVLTVDSDRRSVP